MWCGASSAAGRGTLHTGPPRLTCGAMRYVGVESSGAHSAHRPVSLMAILPHGQSTQPPWLSPAVPSGHGSQPVRSLLGYDAYGKPDSDAPHMMQALSLTNSPLCSHSSHDFLPSLSATFVAWSSQGVHRGALCHRHSYAG